MTTLTAEDLVAAGDPQGALALLQQQVRGAAADPRLRVFLAQLLCVLGQWDRASTQFALCGEMDAASLPMVDTYRTAILCEAQRDAVFAGRAAPVVVGKPQSWVAALVEALQADARGDAAAAGRLREQAFEAAPSTAGMLNGEPFEWIADADPRLGPVLEAIVDGEYRWLPFETLTRVAIEPPVDLRDLVWVPARLGLRNGGQTVALLPVRYPGSGTQADGALQLARRTEWIEVAPECFHGLGQRLLTTSGPELGLLEVRELRLVPASNGPGA